MNNIKKWILLGLISFSFLSIVLTFIINRDAPPVAALEIPQSTIDFFKKLSDLGHIKIKLVDSLEVDDYDNEKDYSDNFKKLEDENFIIFYRDAGQELERAQKTLEYANEAINPLADFFGKYYYAKEAKNRKLPIYLTVSQADFNKVAVNIGGTTVEWAAGLTFNSYSTVGETICNGIILNFMVQDGESTDLKKVVFHEMAHYNHFQCMDLTRTEKIYMDWEVEGIASYFAKDWNKRIPDNKNINDYSIMESPENYKDSYWIGYHVFSAFEVNYNSNNFHKLIKESYTKSIIDAIPLVSGYNVESFEKIWRLHCNRQKGQLSASKKQIQ